VDFCFGHVAHEMFCEFLSKGMWDINFCGFSPKGKWKIKYSIS